MMKLKHAHTGAFGTVYCSLTNDGKLIAVKQISRRTDVGGDQEWEEFARIQEEVEIFKHLRHENIVRYAIKISYFFSLFEINLFTVTSE